MGVQVIGVILSDWMRYLSLALVSRIAMWDRITTHATTERGDLMCVGKVEEGERNFTHTTY